MTGYGKMDKNFPTQHITAEIRTLNSKTSDISLRLPSYLREKDLEIRKIAGEKLFRGKIDITIQLLSQSATNVPVVNPEVIRNYLRQLEKLQDEPGMGNPEHWIQSILRWPEILTEPESKVSDEEWEQILEVLIEAINRVNRYREQEGKAIAQALTSEVQTIKSLLGQVKPLEKERIESIRTKLTTHLNEAKRVTGTELERLEQEIFYYLEKMDITEEKNRLEHHCRYFLETLESSEHSGKKLGFILQEMGREINTLGAKAYHAGIQKIVVRMKDSLEKIKEQVLNVL